MEVLHTLLNTQLLYPAVAVAAVLFCAAVVFLLGFRAPVEPSYNKSPLLQEDRKQNKKRKVGAKDKNRVSDDSKNETSKKSPTKEKLQETQKPKQRPIEVKIKVEKKAEEGRRGKKPKTSDEEKPVDFDEGDWEEVPKKDKKKAKAEDQKDSPVKSNNKNRKESDARKENKIEVSEPANAAVVDVQDAVDVDRVNRELREKINELQRVLKEAELRDNGLLPDAEPNPPAVIVPDDKKKNKKDKKKTELIDARESVMSTDKENIPEPTEYEDNQQSIMFDQLGDTKAPKKTKKKVRKE